MAQSITINGLTITPASGVIREGDTILLTGNRTTYTVTGRSGSCSICLKPEDKGIEPGSRLVLENAEINVAHASGRAAVQIDAFQSEVVIRGHNELYSGYYCAGLQCDGAVITISGGGYLRAWGGCYGAGIGGSDRNSFACLTIEGGSIAARGGDQGAGIGGGSHAGGGELVLKGGRIVARGGWSGAGMGGGYMGRSVKFMIRPEFYMHLGSLDVQGGGKGAFQMGDGGGFDGETDG